MLRLAKMQLWFFSFTISFAALAQEVTVFEVQKNIPLTNDEVVYKDYYMSGGAHHGVKRGMIVSILRKIPIHDNLKNKSQGFLMNPVGRLQVIHVEQDFSIARLYSTHERDHLPVLEMEGIMVGDMVDLANAQEPKSGEEKPTKKSSRKEESKQEEEQKDQASKLEIKPKAATAPPVTLPAAALPAAIGLPKPVPVDKPNP